MKLTTTICLVILVSIMSISHTNAQSFKNMNLSLKGLSFGYRSTFAHMQAYEDIKSFYNETRPWLDNEFSTSNYMNGFEIGVGTTNRIGGISICNLAFCFNKDVAKGTNNNIEYKRVVKSRYVAVETIDFWVTPLHLGGINIGGGIMPLGLHWYTFKPTLNGERPELGIYADPKLSSTLSQLSMNHNIHIDITNGKEENGSAWHFQFYFHFASDRKSTTNELLYLNKELNPTTFESFNQRTLMKADHFGCKLLLLI